MFAMLLLLWSPVQAAEPLFKDGVCPLGYRAPHACNFLAPDCVPWGITGVSVADPVVRTFARTFEPPRVHPVIHHDIIGDELHPRPLDPWLLVAASSDPERPPLVPGPGMPKVAQRRILPLPR